ncbi:MAG: hypothetical protein SGI74_10920 [Oligoflexia bacterium]|nr:hypothetical protein [Oligoflexia bacterium]
MAVVLSHASISDARVFNFKSQTAAAYLRGAVGLNKLQKYAYAPGFPTIVDFPDNDGVNQNYSGEFGFSFTKGITTRLGVELLYPQLTKELEGRVNTLKALSVTSQVYAVIPQINFEIPMKSSTNYKLFIGGGAGYALATLKNTVTMTPTGTTLYGVTDYIEEGSGFGIMGQAFAGIEFSFFDNVSMSLDSGYRYLVVNNYTANRSASTVRGRIESGNQIKNIDGTNRFTDLSGPWAAMTFRFYFN